MESTLKKNTSKQLIWIGMGSIAMFFAGLTSAYIVRKGEGNWVELILPEWFWYSTITIILSSFALVVANQKIKKGKSVFSLVLIAFILGLLFSFFQLNGWKEMINQGVYFTGNVPNDNTMTISYFDDSLGIPIHVDSLNNNDRSINDRSTYDVCIIYSDVISSGIILNKGVLPYYNFMLKRSDTIYGCTDTLALNYNRNVTVDDGSCYYTCESGVTVFSTTHPYPLNYNLVWKDTNGHAFLEANTTIFADSNFSIPVCLPGCYNLSVTRTSTYNVSGSFLYVLTLSHFVHLIGGLIALMVTVINAIRKKYSADNYLGLEITSIYWHFLTILWIYLYCFLMYL